MKKLVLLCALLALTAACGKRAPLRPPSDDKPEEEEAISLIDGAAASHNTGF